MSFVSSGQIVTLKDTITDQAGNNIIATIAKYIDSNSDGTYTWVKQ